jgi:diphosphomevalonate decarboxylase
MLHQLYKNPELLFKDNIPSGKTSWRSPSNIALVKYWGKKDIQLPMNPSISLTLNKSFTETSIEYSPAEKSFKLDFFFNDKRNEVFESKTKKFFESIVDIFPFIKQLKFTINSSNSFPHSAGIASSASGMSALAVALCDIERKHFKILNDNKEFFKKASYVSRLGSGSACRSVYGGVVIWGKSKIIENSSDYYGVEISDIVHKDFLNYQDTILLVDAGQKKVSSRAGHALMNSNVYASTRFKQAHDNINKIIEIMHAGDKEEFVKIVESEALTLHAMMMTSNPYYLLLKPNTLNIIDKIFNFRNNTKIPVCFTLDAGPNVHLLYPESDKKKVLDFIDIELKELVSNKGYILDTVGKGPEKI